MGGQLGQLALEQRRRGVDLAAQADHPVVEQDDDVAGPPPGDDPARGARPALTLATASGAGSIVPPLSADGAAAGPGPRRSAGMASRTRKNGSTWVRSRARMPKLAMLENANTNSSE